MWTARGRARRPTPACPHPAASPGCGRLIDGRGGRQPPAHTEATAGLSFFSDPADRAADRADAEDGPAGARGGGRVAFRAGINPGERRGIRSTERCGYFSGPSKTLRPISQTSERPRLDVTRNRSSVRVARSSGSAAP